MAHTAAHAARRLEPASTAEADAGALLGDLRRRGFDLRRPVFLAYFVELRSARDAAYLLWRRAADDGWRSSLYADSTGWVVRLGRLVRPRVDALAAAAQEAEELAASYDGGLRGLTVEDLAVDDTWSRLVDEVRREQGAPGDDPEPRVVALRQPA